MQISDPHALDCLCLSYKISWPLNIILDDAVMLQYSKVFKFLLMIGRVLWVLQEDFRMMKVEHEAAISEQYHKVFLIVLLNCVSYEVVFKINKKKKILLFCLFLIVLSDFIASTVQAFDDTIYQCSS